jgi:hypothetical protein
MIQMHNGMLNLFSFTPRGQQKTTIYISWGLCKGGEKVQCKKRMQQKTGAV